MTALTGSALTENVVSRESFRPRIFLDGLCERTHGMSDSTSFGRMALREAAANVGAEPAATGWLLASAPHGRRGAVLRQVRSRAGRRQAGSGR
jgi:hypothetical protein